MLTTTEANAARELYRQWFAKYPKIKNPTDMNCKEKYDFGAAIGWEDYALMQRARKSHTKANDWPYPWTKIEGQ